jgi:MFS family permease
MADGNFMVFWGGETCVSERTHQEIGSWPGQTQMSLGRTNRRTLGGLILTLLRTIQGIGVGGEWDGSVLLSMEWSRGGHHNCGFLASWPQFGVPAGLFLSTIVMLGAAAVSGDQFLNWGWRVPFFLSVILVGIGLWIRLGILETPVLQKLLNENKIERAPILEVLKKQPKEVCLSALLRMGQQPPFYIFTAFVFSYGVATLHMPRDFILTAVTVASCVSFISIPLFGHISDRIGRRKMYLAALRSAGCSRSRILACWIPQFRWLCSSRSFCHSSRTT